MPTPPDTVTLLGFDISVVMEPLNFPGVPPVAKPPISYAYPVESGAFETDTL